MKKLIGILLLLAGIVLLCTSLYIKYRVVEESEQINTAQRTINLGRTLSSKNPTTEAIGKPVADIAQTKIDTAQQDITRYEGLAGQLQIGGMALTILGLFVIFFSRKKVL